MSGSRGEKPTGSDLLPCPTGPRRSGSAAALRSRRRTRSRRARGSSTAPRARHRYLARSSRGGAEPDRNPLRTEGLAELLVTPGELRAAVLAGAGVGQPVAVDLVPVAHDHRVLARGAVGRTALLVMHIAGIHIAQAGEPPDLPGTRE